MNPYTSLDGIKDTNCEAPFIHAPDAFEPIAKKLNPPRLVAITRDEQAPSFSRGHYLPGTFPKVPVLQIHASVSLIRTIFAVLVNPV